jgi:hypothetical protein
MAIRKVSGLGGGKGLSNDQIGDVHSLSCDALVPNSLDIFY